ncbi:MAG: hypothetical protein H7Z43_11245 [Clostridia bacterium]|nr:hypothetical protein [Deltaproteobacteria bacterium]
MGSIERIDRNQQDTKRLQEEKGGAGGPPSAAATAKQDLKAAEMQPKSGEDKSASAVTQASKQQDGGESWKAFADNANDISNVPNINAITEKEIENEANQDEQRKQLKAAELQFDLQLKTNGIRC